MIARSELHLVESVSASNSEIDMKISKWNENDFGGGPKMQLELIMH